MNDRVVNMSEVEAEIKAAYRWILGRGADRDGLSHFVEAVASGAMGLDDVRAVMLSSPEFRGAVGSASPEERQGVNELIVNSTGRVVQTGPFAGMKLRDQSMRGDGDVGPKLLGTYEQELHPFLERFASRTYDAVVDVGCAEGYYTVGLAKLFPDTPILAYDTDQGALAILRDMAEDNGCNSHIQTGEFCDPEELERIFTKYPRSLVISDCEGYEQTLFTNGRTNAAGAGSDIVIECHDLWHPGLSAAIIDALEPTHDVTMVYAAGRNPNAFHFLAELNDWDRWRAVWERRGARQNWLICEAKAHSPN